MSKQVVAFSLLAMFFSTSIIIAVGSQGNLATLETFNYYGPGFIQLVSGNGTNSVHRLNPGTTSDVSLEFSVLSSSSNLTQVKVTLVVGGTAASTLNETFDIGLNPSTMELTYQGKSLGYYYMWLPEPISNGSVIDRFLTVVDIRNATYDLQGQIISKSGLDYVVAKDDDPYIRIVNVYNASTGAAVALMIPGRSSIPINLIESGNFTQGHTDIAFAPLGTLLGLNWLNFEPGFESLLISPKYEANLSGVLSDLVPLMSEISPSSPTSLLTQAILPTSVSLMAVIVLIVVYVKYRESKRGQSNR